WHVVGVVVEVAHEDYRGATRAFVEREPVRELETGRDPRPRAERLLPRVRRERLREARRRRARQREVADERLQVAGRRPGRQRLVRLIGEDDEPEAAAAAREALQRR